MESRLKKFIIGSLTGLIISLSLIAIGIIGMWIIINAGLPILIVLCVSLAFGVAYAMSNENDC